MRLEYWYDSVADSASPNELETVRAEHRRHPWLPLVDPGPSDTRIVVVAEDIEGARSLELLRQRCPPPIADGQVRRTLFTITLGRHASVRLANSREEICVVGGRADHTAAAGVAEVLVGLSYLHRSIVSVDEYDVDASLDGASGGLYVAEFFEGVDDLERATRALASRVSGSLHSIPGLHVVLAVVRCPELDDGSNCSPWWKASDVLRDVSSVGHDGWSVLVPVPSLGQSGSSLAAVVLTQRAIGRSARATQIHEPGGT